MAWRRGRRCRGPAADPTGPPDKSEPGCRTGTGMPASGTTLWHGSGRRPASPSLRRQSSRNWGGFPPSPFPVFGRRAGLPHIHRALGGPARAVFGCHVVRSGGPGSACWRRGLSSPTPDGVSSISSVSVGEGLASGVWGGPRAAGRPRGSGRGEHAPSAGGPPLAGSFLGGTSLVPRFSATILSYYRPGFGEPWPPGPVAIRWVGPALGDSVNT